MMKKTITLDALTKYAACISLLLVASNALAQEESVATSEVENLSAIVSCPAPNNRVINCELPNALAWKDLVRSPADFFCRKVDVEDEALAYGGCNASFSSAFSVDSPLHTLSCNNRKSATPACPSPGVVAAWLALKIYDDTCDKQGSWGVNQVNHKVWVSNGCREMFTYFKDS